MTRFKLPFVVTALATGVLALSTVPLPIQAQSVSKDSHRTGYVETPDSSIRRAENLGKRAHTNVLLWRDDSPRIAGPNVLNSVPSASWETPASIACVYKIVAQVSGCKIASATTLPTGGYGAVAIVDAYDDPDAASDLATFSSYFHLPAANFSVVFASGSRPAQDSSGGWELETSLDIEWAHAMAPGAKIILVEAASNSNSDLVAAEQVAGSQVSAAGGGVVSNSFGGTDFSTEQSYDSSFSTSGVVYLASTGDCAFCVEWPSVSPNVVAVGGTSLARDGSGNFTTESYWDDAYGGGGGGQSRYEPRPSYQNTVQSIVGSWRGVPDLSSDADPSSGVAVYDSFPYNGVTEGWIQLGGTSVSSPTTAGRVNATGPIPSTSALQTYIYGLYASNTAYPNKFRDITSGNSECVTGWDFCTGIGSPLGTSWTKNTATNTGLPMQYTCNSGHGFGTPDNPQGPLQPSGGDALLSSETNGSGTNLIERCVWSNFNLMPTITTKPMTLSFDADVSILGNGSIAYISVSTLGTVVSGNYSGTYNATLPTGTNLTTLSVTGYVKASSINGSEADVEIGNIIVH